MSICPKCQSNNNPGNRFCVRCGTALSQQTPPQSPADQYMVTFHRPAHFQWWLMKMHVVIDDMAKYEIANDSSAQVRLSPGKHNVVISFFGQPRKKKFTVDVQENMTLTCTPTVASTLTYLAVPVKVTDQSGRVY